MHMCINLLLPAQEQADGHCPRDLEDKHYMLSEVLKYTYQL